MERRTNLEPIIKRATTDERYAKKLAANFDQETRALKLSDTEKRELKAAIIRIYPGLGW